MALTTLCCPPSHLNSNRLMATWQVIDRSRNRPPTTLAVKASCVVPGCRLSIPYDHPLHPPLFTIGIVKRHIHF